MARRSPFQFHPIFCIHFELSAPPCLDAVSVLPQVQVPIGPVPGGDPAVAMVRHPDDLTLCAKGDRP